MKFTPKIMAEISISAALALVFSFIKVTPVSQGGSISLCMVPIFILALRRGPLLGIIGGVLLGFLQLLSSPFVVHPIQLLLDYPLAYGAIGLAGFLPRSPYFAVILGGLARLVAHFLSGAIFFASYAPKGMNVFLYSLAYNASYMVPEIIISCLLVYLLLKKAPGLLLK